MRKAFANLLIADVQLIRNNEVKFTKGKIMFAKGEQVLGINKQLTAEQGSNIAKNGISATHYYIKFIPRNDKDYDLLKMDSNLVTYPFPLDNEITPYSGSYRDPAVAKGVPTYQYAAVPIGYKLPNLPYQKLEDLYLPNEQNKNSLVQLKADGGSSFTVTVQQLVNQALCDGDGPIDPPAFNNSPANNTAIQSSTYKAPTISLVPPVDDDDPCEGGGGGGGYPPGDPYSSGDNWRPNGRITLFDESHGRTIGVEGIKVRARRWFTTYTGITDANGQYAVDGWFTRPANYWLDFERYDFTVNNIYDYTHEISGPKIEAPWNLDLTGYDKFVGNIFRAAIHYYHKDIHGLHRPPQNSFWAAKLHFFANPALISNSTGITFPVGWHLGESITIDGLLASSKETYSTTIHELAHAAHWDNSNLSFLLSASTASESWATGVEWYLTKMEYPDYPGVYWPRNVNYRNVVIDLIDTPSDISFMGNPLNFNNFGFAAPDDQVQGYTIVEIQNAIINNPTTWNEWKTNIINNYNNGTEQHVETLFNAWLNY